MGGLAIKPIIGHDPDRFSNEELEHAKLTFMTKITSYEGAHMIPMSYKGKTSHGDLDIIMAMPNQNRDQLIAGYQYVRNGNVFSLVHKQDGKTFQVDLICYDTNDINHYHKMHNLWHYMSHGNFGNILGKVLDGYSFQLSGERGLVYQVRKGHFIHCPNYDEANIVIGTIELDGNFARILQLVGLDYRVWLKGFHDNKEASEYIATSPMFDTKFFDASNFKHADRCRTKKRNAYEDIQQIQKHASFTRHTLIDHMASNIIAYKDLPDRIAEIGKDYIYATALNEKYKHLVNSTIITTLTGRTGKDLGTICKTLKDRYPADKYVMTINPSDFTAIIMDTHAELINLGQ